jgi:hypothetical protein
MSNIIRKKVEKIIFAYDRKVSPYTRPFLNIFLSRKKKYQSKRDGAPIPLIEHGMEHAS